MVLHKSPLAVFLVFATTLLMIAATRDISLAEGPEAPTQVEQASQDIPSDVTTRGLGNRGLVVGQVL